MKKSLFLSMTALSVLVFSCKKDDDSNADKIKGKWNLLNIYTDEYYGGISHKDTSTYASGAYTVEFTGDGKMIETYNSSSQTSAYKVDGSNLIINMSDTIGIRTLSGSDLQLHSKDIDGSEYYEITINMKK